ncbi:TMV resistance protein [Nymphaea thermarum]|nr:TMV resistance protein [Nymphaea thermarum]
MWKGSKLSPIPAIRILERKSLIRISDKTGEFEMHDQIRDMGRQIVRQQSSVPSRLWENEETLNLLQEKQGTENVEAIFPQLGWGRISLNTKQFKNMPKLRMLDISGGRLEGSYHHFCKSLKWLRWRRCPLKSLPISFHLRNVVVLDLSSSEIEEVWDQTGWKWSSMMKNSILLSPSRHGHQAWSFGQLNVLDLGWCKNLRGTPDFRLIPNVAKLIFDGCTSLRRVDESIGHLRSLICLNLRECSSLEQIPDTISCLSSLETLDLHGCSNVSTLPENLGNLTSLKNLVLDATNLTGLPESVTLMVNLKLLSLCRCRSLKQLPELIGRLKSLTEFQISQGEMPSIPESIGLLTNLQKLKIEGCRSLVALPASIRSLENLEDLSIEGCKGIRDIPDFFGGLLKLKRLNMGGTDLLKALPSSFFHLRSLERWSFSCTGQQFEWAGGADFSHLSSLTHVDFSPHFASYSYACRGLHSGLDTFPRLESLDLSRCRDVGSIPKLPPSLIHLNAACCEALETISDVSNLNMLRELNLNKCGNLVDIPGLEKLKCLEDLDLRECTSLSDALWNRMKEANFEGYVKLRLPGFPNCSSPNGTAVISFLVPNLPSVGSFSVQFERFWRGQSVTSTRFIVSKDDFSICDRRGMQWREMSLREMECGELESNARIGCLVLREQKEAEEVSQMLANGNGYRTMDLTVAGAYKLRKCSIVLRR